MHIDNVTLEISLKPFCKMDDKSIADVCREMFVQWHSLVRNADMVSVLLWTADGSEILDYTGRLEDKIEWARYIGGANPKHAVPNDPDSRALHSRYYLYDQNAPVITYGDLKRIISIIKMVAMEVTGKSCRVGATFDPGPEFAKSPFKYERHNEICMAASMGDGQCKFVTCYSKLHADKGHYAGFSDGIPEGIPLGTFLGRQAQHFLSDMGFDYLWFSNGFGFGKETWGVTGELFDGKKFDAERADNTVGLIREFWETFRLECPDYLIETRGTNLSNGIDIATDGTDYEWLMEAKLNYAAPPNSPWAALNSDFGLELMGYMSRIAEIPSDISGYPFRFYTHDPWWLNSPWLDRYNRQPHDIYLPMSVARLDCEGKVENPSVVEILTVDDSYGRMPPKVPNEVIPHLLNAVQDAPDQPGPLVWIFPFVQYHRHAFGVDKNLSLPFFGDWFIRSAINAGLPLNTVISDQNFLSSSKETLKGSTLIAMLPDEKSELAALYLEFIGNGGNVIFYGPTVGADRRILHLLGINNQNVSIYGVLGLELDQAFISCDGPEFPNKVHHRPNICAGGCCATLNDASEKTRVIATYHKDNARRVAAVISSGLAGKAAWVRGSINGEYRIGHLLSDDDAGELFNSGVLMRMILSELGWSITFNKESLSQPSPMSCISRCRNGFYISGYIPDLTVGVSMATSLGVPILTGYDHNLLAGRGACVLPRACHEECRVFVAGQASGRINCRNVYSGEIGISRRIMLKGLSNATVRFFPEYGKESNVTFRRPEWLYLDEKIIPHENLVLREGPVAEIRDISGEIMISW